MIHIYLLNEGSRAAIYGIGTYIKQLKECICHNPLFTLTVIELSSEKKEFALYDMGDFREIYIPIGKIYFPENPIYYRNAWYLIKPYIPNNHNEKIIFHLNYYQQFPLISLMKSDFPTCKTLFTIHYQSWCLSLNGNLSQFQQIIQYNSFVRMNGMEKEIYDSFQKERNLYNAIDIIITLAKYTQNILTVLYKIDIDKTRLIYNGIKDEYIALSKSDKDKLKNRLYFRKNDKIFLFVGRLDPIKGLDILLSSYKNYLNKSKKAKLIIIGDGDFSTYLKKVKDCWDKITFTGILDKNDLYQFYQIADIGIMPSMHEQCSYVAIEMMMFGIPIIGTTSTGLSEMIENDVNGWKVPIVEHLDDIEISEDILEEKLRLVKTNQYAKIKKNARKTYLEKYELNCMCKEYMDLYKMEL
jgi:glycosyltransferase